MKVLVACATKFHSDHLAYQMQKRGLLYRVISSFPYSIYANREKIDRRKFLWLPPAGLVSKIASRINLPQALQSRIDCMMARLFDFTASFFLGSADISISWAWSSYFTIKSIKKRGGLAILEKCASFGRHQKALLEEEYSNLGLSCKDITCDKILDVEEKECKMSDYILCPSKYVASSLVKYGIEEKKIIVIPYGVDTAIFSPAAKKDGIFRVIFVGSVGARKGLIYLFQALKEIRLKNFEAVIIGKVEPCFTAVFNRYKEYFTHIPCVKHEKLKYYYSNASVFILPSLDEGMAYVQLEAMACGLPVICTENSGGEGVIRDKEEGFIIPIRDSAAIKDKIEYLYNNPSELSRMSRNAAQRARHYTWDDYGKNVAEELNRIIGGRIKA